ncbi:MAG: UDP-glucose/GDP-mannose dehydrogenase family protein [Phycisphaeraceae bacterium]|nr:UDP-glucose/GDP-mannose dehydrogenase family protein [Phycisphaeraceae bacterium]
MKIAIVGTGYVGLVTGTCLANSGNDVTCLDVVEQKIQKLRQGVSPIYEPGLEELIRRNIKANRLHFTTDKRQAYGQAEIIFICVGTPSDDQGHADLKYVLAAGADVGDAIEAAPARPNEPPIIIVKSTVPVGTNAKVRAAIAARTSKPFAMASNPEFLKEGAAIADFNRPDRVVLGVADKTTGERLRELYEPFVRQGNPIFVMDIPSAEMVKYASNAMLATKISFINEIARLCEAFGADVDEVRRGMCADKRIGNQFLYPGLGYGGSCFPKDVLACISMGLSSNTPTDLLKAVHEVNQQQRTFFLGKILEHFGRDLTGKRFAVWGIAFKPGTDDIREAPSLTIMKRLLDHGATIAAHDPVAHETCRAVLGDRITYCDEPYAALDGADALVLCTDWDEFKHPDFEQLVRRMNKPVVFDGRNLYRRQVAVQEGLTYFSIGRAAVDGDKA